MKKDRIQKHVWLLMFYGAEGWLPSADYSYPWRTKSAALRRIKELGERGKQYRAMKFSLAEPPL